MDFVSELNCITKAFIHDYPLSLYPELMYKQGRPYNCLLVDLHCNYLICIPYRSHINHNNAFHFKNSIRSKQNKSGLDYSKMLIIQNSAYLCATHVTIDQDEYKETIVNIKKIVKEAIQYLDDYVNHHNKIKVLNYHEYNRRYKFTTLQYFHNILKLPQTKKD